MQVEKERLKRRSSKLSKQNHIIEQIAENGNLQYNCTACRKVFRSRSQRYYHINCNQLGNLVFKCEHCDKSFSRRTQLKYHTESHLSPVNKCDKCQKTFSNPLALKKHFTLHITEPKVCPHCDKAFKKKISLDQHVFAQHLNHLQYGCAHCNKKYASKSALHLHLQTHEKKRFECTFCGKLFQRNSILNLHIKRHNNASSYRCAICQKTFSESGALARHSKLHQEGVLQYYCKICDKSMLRKDNMTRHLTTIHPEKMFDEVVKTLKPLSKQDSDDNCSSTKNFLIIENKLLRKPFDIAATSNNITQASEKQASTEGCPVINQIKVITAVPTFKNEISQGLAKESKTTNQLEQTVSMSETHRVSYNTSKMEEKAVEEVEINEENLYTVNNNYENNIYQPEEKGVEHQLNYFDAENKVLDFKVCKENSVEKESIVKDTFSSVIKSVGNVQKDLTSYALLSVNAKNQISAEYKHKKYCRNNYNIDLYRRILGFDEDDEDENIQQQQKYDHVPKSSTPVHWRKCFKNNYETSGS